MTTLTTLLWADVLGFKQWFATKTLSRLIVTALFGLVFAGIASGLFKISHFFFLNLASFEQFGQLTAEYIIHAAICIILWLGIGSSVAATIGLLTTTNPTLLFLVSLPIKQRHLSQWIFLKAMSANLLLLLFVCVPIITAYASAFGISSDDFVSRILLTVSSIVITTTSIGSLLALPLAKNLRGREYLASLLGLAIFFIVMVGLIKLIFPSQMSQLYRLSPEEFTTTFTNLPLNHPELPTYWLATTITNGLSLYSLAGFFATIVVMAISLWLQTRFFVSTLLKTRAQAYTAQATQVWKKLLLHSPLPLLTKEWLSIWRSPSETGYGVFLFSIASFFFFFLAVATRGAYFRGDWQLNLITFAFGWLLFFTIALLLRFIYPLMARESTSAWYSFSLPISPSQLLKHKVSLALLLNVPLYLLAIVVWELLPFAAGNRLVLIGYSLLCMFWLTIYQSLLGAINPNFAQGNDPDKTSTSGMGLLTLVISAALVTITSLLVEQIFTRTIAPSVAITSLVIGGGLGSALLWALAKKAMQRYQF